MTALKALLILGAVAVATAQIGGNCGTIVQGTIIADNNNCNAYFVCDNGLLLSHTCPSGQNYNPVDQACEWNYNCASQSVFGTTTEVNWLYPNNINAGSSSSGPCFGLANGSYTAVANSCTQFYYCMNGAPLIGTCPTGYGFSSTYSGCVYGNSCA